MWKTAEETGREAPAEGWPGGRCYPGALGVEESDGMGRRVLAKTRFYQEVTMGLEGSDPLCPTPAWMRERGPRRPSG